MNQAGLEDGGFARGYVALKLEIFVPKPRRSTRLRHPTRGPNPQPQTLNRNPLYEMVLPDFAVVDRAISLYGTLKGFVVELKWDFARICLHL